ncbi:hypothetical protein GR702_10860 [Novosphingobium sp. FGD1]|jgi:hypothetical protein|uniref:DUF3106 domain-containing protein n=1 Tax=Novosphingobium silvae TaxID=2692619 RepID=A0A7X4GGN9_9SPHN|nr:hypothetical protein [Novosphingobium silvae]MYL98265.1 hypothetical protein [Novosphingobium silvae]
MHKLLLAGSAAVALMATPGAYAQNTRELPAQTTNTGSPAPSSSAPVLTSEQKAIHDAWTAQQKADYAAWPNDYKVYYWTLNAEQQEGYWALTADQRGQIYKMTPEQRQMAWNSVVQQMNGQTPATPAGQANPPGQGVPTAGVPDPQTASQAARPAMPADENYQGGPYKGALTPPPATAMDKTYPKCSKTVTDGCVNRGGI